MIDKLKTQLIALEVIRVLKTRFDNFPEGSQENRNAPFHEAFLNAFKDKIERYVDNTPFFISLASWLHGLNTTLGQSFFENVAHILSDGEKKTFKDCKYYENQEAVIIEIITDLQNGSRKPNLYEENKAIFSVQSGELKEASNFTADVFIMDDGYIEAIELKSVRPNAGEMRGEKLKILKAKACLKLKYPDKDIRYYIGFPFDPFSDTPTGYNKERFMKHLVEFEKYFDPEEVLLAGELWDRLSGEKNTMEMILSIINDIATPSFIEEFNFINELENLLNDKERYLDTLKRWHLYYELEIAGSYERLKARYSKVMNQAPFKQDGKYNFIRAFELLRAITQD